MRPKKAVTMADVAEELGVSIVSVSNALNGRKGVSPILRSRVIETADKLGYQIPERESVGSDGQKLYRTAVYVSGSIPERYQDLTVMLKKKIREEVSLAGAVFVGEDASEADGGVVLGGLAPGEEENIRKECRWVCLGLEDPSQGMDYVLPDTYHAGEVMAEHMISLGHTRLGFVAGRYYNGLNGDLYMGVSMALEKAGLPGPVMIRETEEGVKGQDLEMFDELPTAWVCADEVCGRELTESLQSLGYTVPKNISVCVFLMNGKPDRSKPVTGYLPSWDEVVKQAVRHLTDRNAAVREGARVFVSSGTFLKGTTAGNYVMDSSLKEE